ncbi:MAG TPA: hypothetical protein VH143_32280 [Kofleriaceae bacterium]|nr:hypothetical protein [Kofleriaceae bacterium]
MIRALAIAAALAAPLSCIDDNYACTSDGDCNLGVAGRCEVDHHCTQFDPTCAMTQRRYTEHSGAESQACFLGQIELANACAAGQPPASPSDPCGAVVCDALPTCCNTGWSESCVLEAERSCGIACDTRVAVSASRGSALELWDLRYDGSAFTAELVTDRVVQLDWLAPAPGEAEPRLAGFVGSDTLALVSSAGELDVTIPPDRAYHDVASVDLARAVRDTIALAWEDPVSADEQLELTDLGSMTSVDFDTGVSNAQAWGDINADGYPDGAAGTGSKYVFLINQDDGTDDHDRELDASVQSSFNGSAHSGITSMRDLVWRDIDGDSQLDLAAFGNSIRLHQGGTDHVSTPYLSIDCDPPVVLPNSTCDESLANFVGTVVPAGSNSIVYAGNTQARELFEIVPDGIAGTATITAISIPTGVGSAAFPESIITRDFDGDHVLDVVVIDSELGIWTSLSKQDPTGTKFTYHRVLSAPPSPMTVVHASISGMPK